MSILENGRETLDQTPVAYPLRFTRPEPIHLRIRRMILEQMQESASYTEIDTAEEADDFSVPDDDPLLSSPYEMEDDFDHMYEAKWQNPEGGAGGGNSPSNAKASGELPPHDGESPKSAEK